MVNKFKKGDLVRFIDPATSFHIGGVDELVVCYKKIGVVLRVSEGRAIKVYCPFANTAISFADWELKLISHEEQNVIAP